MTFPFFNVSKRLRQQSNRGQGSTICGKTADSKRMMSTLSNRAVMVKRGTGNGFGAFGKIPIHVPLAKVTESNLIFFCPFDELAKLDAIKAARFSGAVGVVPREKL